jgi:hypothetical protein
MEIGELVAMASAADDPAKCPFCGKKLHDFPKRKKKPDAKVKSKPKQLACEDVKGGGAGKWTTAKHHLICAKQCYALLKPLVRMASMVGYDVNDKPNGLGLPTFKNPYDGKIWGGGAGKKKNYGKMDSDEKQKVADHVMKTTKAQWHVGHHKFEQQIDWDVEEFGDDDEMPHSASYDTAVLERLYELFQAYTEDPVPCEEEEDEGSDIKADLDNLSEEIKTAINMFNDDRPRESYPYFVSQRAVTYAGSFKG